MKRTSWVLWPLLLCACGPTQLPPPSIVSVMPGQVAAGVPSTLSVRVDAVLPLTVDYQAGGVDPAQLSMAMRLAGQEVDVPFAEPDGTLIVPVPEGLPEGAYDVQLTLADGREAVREQAFSVVPAATLNGPNPNPQDGFVGGVRSFLIDPIPEQVRDRPFQITLRADGPEAKLFQAPVSLRASVGTLTLVTPGAFVDGVLVEELSMSHPGANIYLLVEDTQGHKGLSNSFRVRPN
ncbi:MAG: hypothetical protein ACJ8AT_35245 [Hyalangium sp.]|uniref:hypothetical protein n=1 Tax=Hyalangium sp. TaxID=2028555 RepID=UPI00389A4358